MRRSFKARTAYLSGGKFLRKDGKTGRGVAKNNCWRTMTEGRTGKFKMGRTRWRSILGMSACRHFCD